MGCAATLALIDLQPDDLAPARAYTVNCFGDVTFLDSIFVYA